MKSICQNLNGPSGSSNVGTVEKTSLVILLTNGVSEVGTFCGGVNASSPILSHECYHFVSKSMGYNPRIVVRRGTFRIKSTIFEFQILLFLI